VIAVIAAIGKQSPTCRPTVALLAALPGLLFPITAITRDHPITRFFSSP
jgi:hypothetical protein